jgi:hypothetical protein
LLFSGYIGEFPGFELTTWFPQTPLKWRRIVEKIELLGKGGSAWKL